MGQYAPPQAKGKLNIDFSESPVPYKQNQPIKAMPQDFRASMSGTLMGESELVPLDPNYMSSFNNVNLKPSLNNNQQAASKPSIPQPSTFQYNPAKQPNAYLEQLDKMGAGQVKLETESAVDTMDFVNKIVNNGRRSELPLPSSLPQKREDANRFADKLDTGVFDFNFPQIPAYEGIQNNLLNFDNVISQPQQQQSSYLPKPDIFSNAY